MSDLCGRFEATNGARVLVVGDVMLDRYTWGDAGPVSPEAPVLVLRAEDEEVRLGVAASVACLLRHLGAEVTLAGVVGDDPGGRTVRRLLEEIGIDSDLLLVDSDRCTTTKERFVGRAAGRHAHQILRVDHETTQPVSGPVESKLLAAVAGWLDGPQAILVSDHAIEQVVGHEVVEDYGGEVRVTSEIPGISTTRMIASIRAGAMKITDCQCNGPGWCERHRCYKNLPQYRACRRIAGLFALWEQGRGPGQSRAQRWPKAAASVCLLRGETIRTAACPTCRGQVEIKLFKCELHSQCTVGKRIRFLNRLSHSENLGNGFNRLS